MEDDEKEQLAKMMARSKREWWQHHHGKNEGGVMHSMARELQALFEVLGFTLFYEKAIEIVEPHAQAAMLHDKAEKFGDEGRANMEVIYWGRVEALLLKYSANLINEIDMQINEKKKIS